MFLHPWWLAALVLVPLLAWRLWFHRKPSTIEFSSAASWWDQPPTWRQRLVWLPGLLSLLALTLMIISLARPRLGREQTVVDAEGIAIEMVVDRSGSMQALDFRLDGEHVDRLTAIKNVAAKFVLGDEQALSDSEVAGRAGDLIGLITFAGYADAMTPPTLDHAFLVAQLAQTQIVQSRREDGTAIGDALTLAVDKLTSLDEGRQEKVKSKVIILLTDGENTAGEIEPAEAAELAKALGVKIYTIGVGTKGRAPFPVQRLRNGQVLVDYVPVNIDEEALKQIAQETAGRYFRATDTDSLEAIYEEIDQLEKTKVEIEQFVDYRELAVQPVFIGRWRIPPLLLIAFWSLCAAVMIRQVTGDR